MIVLNVVAFLLCSFAAILLAVQGKAKFAAVEAFLAGMNATCALYDYLPKPRRVSNAQRQKGEN